MEWNESSVWSHFNLRGWLPFKSKHIDRWKRTDNIYYLFIIYHLLLKTNANRFCVYRFRNDIINGKSETMFNFWTFINLCVYSFAMIACARFQKMCHCTLYLYSIASSQVWWSITICCNQKPKYQLKCIIYNYHYINSTNTISIS